MTVSVVIPVYNVAPYLADCLDSVRRAARRLFEMDATARVEIVCVDDGSTDDSAQILDSSSPSPSSSPLSFRVIHQKNAGVSAARNRGMAEATGDLVAFIDADDTFDERALALVAEVHTRSGAEVIRYGCNSVVDHASDVPLEGNPSFDAISLDVPGESPLKRCTLGGSSVISARLAKSQRWPSMTHCEDPLFMLRCMKAASGSVRINGNLFNYLRRPDSAVHSVSLSMIVSTCRYLVMAYDECAALPGFEHSRADTCEHLAWFLRGPLSKCGKDVPPADRKAAEAAVRTASNLLAARDAAFAEFACREVHDFAFVLGSSCTATDVLRQAGLQYGTFPLDWIGRLGIAARTDLMVDGFADFLSIDRLQLEDASDDGRHARYVDAQMGTAFFHDFPVGKPLAETYPAICEKYDRRIARFLRHLRNAKSVLVVWIADFRDGRDGIVADDDVLVNCLDRLERSFPGTHFSMLAFDQADEGAAPCERTVVDGRIRRLKVDYRDWAQGPESWMLRTDRLLPYFSAHTVRDYRTPDERRAHRRTMRLEKYAKLHAKSWWDALLAGAEYRLFRHFQKRLERRGVRLS